MWIIRAWRCILPDVAVKGFKTCCIPNTMDLIADYLLCEWQWGGWDWSEWVWVICRYCQGMQNLSCFVQKVYEINSETFFLIKLLFLGGSLSFGNIHFPWQTFYFGGHLRLESSCIWVHMVLNCITNQKNSLKLHKLGTFLIQTVVLFVKSISLKRIFDLNKN